MCTVLFVLLRPREAQLRTQTTSTSIPVLSILRTEAFRAVLAPFGHSTWTAILGGALFAFAWAAGHFRIDRRVAFTFLA